MKKLIKLTLVVALVLGSSSLFAQKLGRINLEEIITLMPEYKEMMTNFRRRGRWTHFQPESSND